MLSTRYFNFGGMMIGPYEKSTIKQSIKEARFFESPSGVHPRIHAREIDKALGFKIANIERKLMQKYRSYDRHEDDSNRKKHYEGTQTWIGLHPQILQTPYEEMLSFLSLLIPYEPKTLVDLGAGYGRMGIVMNSLFPEASFIGYEIMKERLNEANRMFDWLEYKNCEMRKENILLDSFELPKADVYFIYDFSDPMDIRQILNKLKARYFDKKFFIVAKGEGVRSLIQLKYPTFWSLNGVVHAKNWSLYSSFVDLN